MPRCLIALGSNLGDRTATIREATQQIGNRIGPVSATSNLISSAPAGGPPGQGDFLNAAALCETQLTPIETLRRLQDIETDLGRERGQRWQARTLDLDLLLYDDVVLNEPDLQIPHPRMSFRRFVLEPSAQIAGASVHPTTQLTIAELLRRLDRQPIHIAITGAAATDAVRQTAAATGETPFCRKTFSGDPLAYSDVEREWLLVAGRSPVILSDFWVGESGNASSTNFDRAIAKQVRRDLLEVLECPHLLIVSKSKDESCRTCATDASQEYATVAKMRFPALALYGATVEDVVREATAAIDAMKPPA